MNCFYFFHRRFYEWTIWKYFHDFYLLSPYWTDTGSRRILMFFFSGIFFLFRCQCAIQRLCCPQLHLKQTNNSRIYFYLPRKPEKNKQRKIVKRKINENKSYILALAQNRLWPSTEHDTQRRTNNTDVESNETISVFRETLNRSLSLSRCFSFVAFLSLSQCQSHCYAWAFTCIVFVNWIIAPHKQ